MDLGMDRKPLARVGRRRRRCGFCHGCVREDCGQCRNCRDKVKFGGPGTKKQRCMLRTCANMESKLLQRRSERAAEEKDLTSVKITCVFCGRKRKKGLSRSALFCTKHCQTRWQDIHPGESPLPIPQLSDGDEEQVTTHFLQAAFPIEQFDDTTFSITDRTRVLSLTVPESTTSSPYPVPLSPSPSPLSSPGVYTPPTLWDKVKVNKWKEIARKLSFHRELRNIWNQLKLSGGFSSNEDFISHLLRCESKRQHIPYDILTEETPVNDSVVTADGDMSVGAVLSDPVSDSPIGVGTSGSFEQSDSVEKPTDLKTDTEEDTQLIERETQKCVFESAPCNSQQCELTVLDSQKQCTPDESGLEFCVDEVIDYI